MKNTATVGGILKLLVILSSLASISSGICITNRWSTIPAVTQGSVVLDTSNSTIQKTDTTIKLHKIAAETTTQRSIHSTPALNPIDATLRDNMLKRGYDLILMGLFSLILFLILPYLSEFSLLSLFTAKFRAEVETGKKIINEAASASNSQPPATADTTTAHLSDALPSDKIERYATDPQKGKWGGKSIDAGRKMVAVVVPITGQTGLFRVHIKVISTDTTRPLSGKVTFHLHPSFANPNPSVYVVGGEATLQVISRGLFTIGVEADQDTTRLELDLADMQ